MLLPIGSRLESRGAEFFLPIFQILAAIQEFHSHACAMKLCVPKCKNRRLVITHVRYKNSLSDAQQTQKCMKFCFKKIALVKSFAFVSFFNACRATCASLRMQVSE